MSDYGAIDARFTDVNDRVNHQNTEIIKLASDNAQLRKDVDTHGKEIDAIREAKHIHGNEISGLKINMANFNEKIDNMTKSIDLKIDGIVEMLDIISAKTEAYTRLSWIGIGMAIVFGSTVFYKLLFGG